MADHRSDAWYHGVSEKQWQAQVEEVLGFTGWEYYHTFNAIHSVPGFPDLMALHPSSGDRLVAELKSERGVATPKQLQWLSWFESCGIEAHVWRPSDVDSVVERLQHPVSAGSGAPTQPRTRRLR